jgi:hypothetical protein
MFISYSDVAVCPSVFHVWYKQPLFLQNLF